MLLKHLICWKVTVKATTIFQGKVVILGNVSTYTRSQWIVDKSNVHHGNKEPSQ